MMETLVMGKVTRFEDPNLVSRKESVSIAHGWPWN